MSGLKVPENLGELFFSEVGVPISGPLSIKGLDRMLGNQIVVARDGGAEKIVMGELVRWVKKKTEGEEAGGYGLRGPLFLDEDVFPGPKVLDLLLLERFIEWDYDFYYVGSKEPKVVTDLESVTEEVFEIVSRMIGQTEKAA